MINYNKIVNSAHKRVHQEGTSQVTGEAVPLGLIGHLAYKAVLSTQGSSENVETMKQIINERNGGKQIAVYRVQNHGYKVFQEFYIKG